MTKKSSLPPLLLVTKLTAAVGETSRAKRKTQSEHWGSDQDLPEPAGIVAGRHRAAHRIIALLFVARRERTHRSVARNARQDCRSDGYFPGRFLPRHGNAARPRNAKNAWRTFAGRNPLPGGDQALQQHAFGRRQAAGAGDDSQDGDDVAAARAETFGSAADGVKFCL